MKKLPLLVLFVALAFVLQSSSTLTRVFSEEPKATTWWEITSLNNHLGGVIEATLHITTQQGTIPDWSRLPDIGGTLELPSKADPQYKFSRYDDYDKGVGMISEGELEVVSRQITQYTISGWVVTEITYGLQYLLPIDLSSPSDDKRLPRATLFHGYLVSKAGKVTWRVSVILVDGINFYIVPRVDENSRPFFSQFILAHPTSHWLVVKLAGYGLVAMAFCLPAWRVIGIVIARRRRNQAGVEIFPKAKSLYELWCKNQDGGVFIEALKLYRRGVWGRPSASAWIRTTFVLYSGIKLDRDQVGKFFAQLVKEVADEHPS